MIFLIGSERVALDDKYASYSPYLSVLSSTSVGVDMDGDAFVIEEDHDSFMSYLSYLRGESFPMNEEIEMFFDKMGHPNEMKYPHEYWAIKLRDNWIRDNFYRLELYKDSYYNLVEIPVKNDLVLGSTMVASSCEFRFSPFVLPEYAYIAGGAALYMSGYSDTLGDIDVFFVAQREVAEKYIRDNCSKINDTVSVRRIGVKGNKSYKMQFIHRLYKSPAEIIYGFDLDCVGVLYDGKKLWATERALFSLKNKMNWFDPMRASPSYAFRLSKYKTRGFSIGLPLFSKEDIDTESIDAFFTMLADAFVIEMEQQGDDLTHFSNSVHYNEVKKLSLILPYIATIFKYTTKSVDMHILSNTLSVFEREKRFGSIWGSALYVAQSVLDEAHIPRDPASVLILSEFYSVHSYRWKRSDYDVGLRKSLICGCTEKGVQTICKRFGTTFSAEEVREHRSFWEKRPIIWKEQNPMEQVTSTFQPEPVKDIRSWYRNSMFHRNNVAKKHDFSIKSTAKVTDIATVSLASLTLDEPLY